MFTLTKLSENLKVLAPIILGLLALLILTYLIFFRGVGYGWRGVVPGKTSVESLNKILGKPNQTYTLAKTRMLLFKYKIGSDEAKVYVKDSIVILVKVKPSLAAGIKVLDDGADLVYSPDYVGFKILLLSNKGRGQVVDEISQSVSEQWYFAPDTLINIESRLAQIDRLQDKKPDIF